jgi:hypothetical protein
MMFKTIGIALTFALSTTAGAQNSWVDESTGNPVYDVSPCEWCEDVTNLDFEACYASGQPTRECIAQAILRGERCMARHRCICDPFAAILGDAVEAGIIGAVEACDLLEVVGGLDGWSDWRIGKQPHVTTRTCIGASDGSLVLDWGAP